MCRSQSQGGRRCSGTSRASGGGGHHATTPVPATASTNTAGVPTREATEALAAKMTRQTDGFGRPLTERDRRFFALRESGWTGPIDKDGYPDTTSADAGTLRRMAQDRGETVTW